MFLWKTCKIILASSSCYGLYKLWKLYFSNNEIHEVLFSCEDSMNCRSENSKTCMDCSNKRCFFSNINKMIAIINSSRSSLCLSMYILSHYDLTQAIIKAKARGVWIRVITDHKMFDNNQCLEKLFRKGVPIRYKENDDSIMHHKLCLIDTINTGKVAPMASNAIKLPKQGIVMVGSQNWCLQALTVNYDNTIITTDELIISELQDEFERMWQDFGTNVQIEG